MGELGLEPTTPDSWCNMSTGCHLLLQGTKGLRRKAIIGNYVHFDYNIYVGTQTLQCKTDGGIQPDLACCTFVDHINCSFSLTKPTPCLILTLSLKCRNVDSHQRGEETSCSCRRNSQTRLKLCHQIYHHQWGENPTTSKRTLY